MQADPKPANGAPSRLLLRVLHSPSGPVTNTRMPVYHLPFNGHNDFRMLCLMLVSSLMVTQGFIFI